MQRAHRLLGLGLDMVRGGPIFEGDVEERRHVTASDEAAITLLAVVEGGKYVAIDPTTGRITVDPACADAFQVIYEAIGPTGI